MYMCSLLSNNLVCAVADSGEHVWCILLYLHAIFVATPIGEVSEVQISCVLMVYPSRFHNPLFMRTCSQQFIVLRVHSISVRGFTFMCMRGSVIFSNIFFHLRMNYSRTSVIQTSVNRTRRLTKRATRPHPLISKRAYARVV